METKPTFKVRFWGVRGSYPTPGPETIRYGGNTPCVELEVNGRTIILDSGTGIIPLGRSLARRARERGGSLEATLLLSHLHHDHTQGFPFFVPVHFPNANLHLFGPNLLGADPQMTLESVMQPPYFPLRLADLNARITFGTLRETDLLLIGEAVGGVTVRPTSEAAQYDHADVVQVRSLRSYAHPNGVMHYKISWNGLSVVYATDTEGYVNGDQRLAAFARGASLPSTPMSITWDCCPAFQLPRALVIPLSAWPVRRLPRLAPSAWRSSITLPNTMMPGSTRWRFRLRPSSPTCWSPPKVLKLTWLPALTCKPQK